MPLRQQLAEFGFESNDDYEFPLRCLFEAQISHVRCLNVTGESPRRNTAFANALAHALAYPHVLYHDFSAPEPAAAPVFAPTTEEETPTPLEAPLGSFERSVTEACAYSEGARTILIVDQLQAADFRDHIRLYHFAETGEWTTTQGTVLANRKNLLLVLISEQPLYHSLARISFRLHTGIGRAVVDYRPDEFGLPASAEPLMASFAEIFRALGVGPTTTEYRHILDDALTRVRTPEQLRQSLFGRMEHAERGALSAEAIEPLLARVSAAINRYVGEEHIELGG